MPSRRPSCKTKNTARKPTARKPTARKPTARKPTARKPTARKPTARKPTARKPKSSFKIGGVWAASWMLTATGKEPLTTSGRADCVIEYHPGKAVRVQSWNWAAKTLSMNHEIGYNTPAFWEHLRRKIKTSTTHVILSLGYDRVIVPARVPSSLAHVYQMDTKAAIAKFNALVSKKTVPVIFYWHTTC